MQEALLILSITVGAVYLFVAGRMWPKLSAALYAEKGARWLEKKPSRSEYISESYYSSEMARWEALEPKKNRDILLGAMMALCWPGALAIQNISSSLSKEAADQAQENAAKREAMKRLERYKIEELARQELEQLVFHRELVTTAHEGEVHALRVRRAADRFHSKHAKKITLEEVHEMFSVALRTPIEKRSK
jgi:hypothetical protein